MVFWKWSARPVDTLPLDAGLTLFVGTTKLWPVQAVDTLAAVLGQAWFTFPAPRPSLL